MSRRKLAFVLTAVLTLGLTMPSAVLAEAALQEQLALQAQQIAALQAELASMKQNNLYSYQNQITEAMGPAPAASQGGGGSLVLPAGWSLKPYGYIKADVVYDDSAHPLGDLCGWASGENRQTRSDDEIHFTARQTRLGMVLMAPNIGDLKVRGVIETDFWGAGNVNSAALRIRKAFGEIKGKDWLFMFGQDWEIFSPLFPDTLNFFYGSYSGNPGFRFPQLRFDKWWICPDETKIIAQLALQREKPQDLDGFGIEDGRDSGVPSVLGRIGVGQGRYHPYYYGAGVWQFGLSGYFGREEIDGNYVGRDYEVNTWMVNADAYMTLWENLGIQGEFWWGENTDSHFGATAGNLAHVDPISGLTDYEEIEAFGGWLELGWKPKAEAGAIACALGIGWVDPINGDMPDSQALYDQNHYYYSTIKYYLASYLWTGLEISYYQTSYGGVDATNENHDDGDLFRVQHSWVLKF